VYFLAFEALAWALIFLKLVCSDASEAASVAIRAVERGKCYDARIPMCEERIFVSLRIFKDQFESLVFGPPCALKVLVSE
jgi:hypothetical protein